jgi:hypothetical protein
MVTQSESRRLEVLVNGDVIQTQCIVSYVNQIEHQKAPTHLWRCLCGKLSSDLMDSLEPS